MRLTAEQELQKAMWPYTTRSVIPGKDVRGRRGALLERRRRGKADEFLAILSGGPQGFFERAFRREAPFAGLYVLSSLARARWALDFAIERLRRGGPLSTRLEFVEQHPPCPVHPEEVKGWCKDGTVLVSPETYERLRELERLKP
jgi:hypothetical protein